MLSIKSITKEWKDCKKCPLHKSAHEHVFFRGTAPCDVLFIGEAPGNNEDLAGIPFIGRAGKILDQWIADAKTEMGIAGVAWDYGITNIVACRPTNAEGKIRAPEPDEAKACNPRLIQTIRVCKPRLIVLLGQTAKKHHKITRDLASIPTVELQHPAYVLRQGGVETQAYDTNLVKLTEALEAHLYGNSQEAEDIRTVNKPGKTQEGHGKENIRSRSNTKVKGSKPVKHGTRKSQKGK